MAIACLILLVLAATAASCASTPGAPLLHEGIDTAATMTLRDTDGDSTDTEPDEGEISHGQATEDALHGETHPDETLADIVGEAETQEDIARAMARYIDPEARAGTRITYPYPKGAMAVTLYLNGTRVLAGQVADIGGTVYVPVQRYADLFGRFITKYEAATERVTITGTNLKITVQVGDPYLTVNDRILYTGQPVLSLGGWIFVPLESMSRALGATVTIRQGWYQASVTSGDPTAVPWASTYYNSDDLYWLARIISAEAKGESLKGKIAVGNVVLNRVRSSSFPNTVYGVIFDKKYGTQFSPTANGTIYHTPTAESVMAAKICLEGYTLSSKALYFFNPSIATSSWIANSRPYIMTIGNHKFYG